MYVTCNQRAIGWVIRDKTAVSNLSKVILWMMAPRFEHTILWICAEHLNHSAIAAIIRNLWVSEPTKTQKVLSKVSQMFKNVLRNF